MAKQDPVTAKKFAALLKKALAAHAGAEEPPPRDPIAQLIVGFLQWNATQASAEDAFTAIMDRVIDINDLRISHTHELVDFIGEDYPDAAVRVIRMRESLNAVYKIEHDIHMHSIAGKGKKEQRTYLDVLEGMTPYVAAQVTLMSFGGHAMPIDEKLCALLIGAGCLDEGTSPPEAEAYLTRQVKAGDALEAHLALQAWADTQADPRDQAAAPSAAATATKTKKTTKKKTAKKKVVRTKKK
ncbi:MAG: hypothetical protein AAGG38_06090 [Planctomycetota bacterium]